MKDSQRKAIHAKRNGESVNNLLNQIDKEGKLNPKIRELTREISLRVPHDIARKKIVS